MHIFLVLEDISEQYTNNTEEQIFHVAGYGVKVIIPPSSVQKGQDIQADIHKICCIRVI